MDLHINDIFEDDLDMLEIIDIGFPRMNYTRSNHFHEMDEYNFFKRFPLTKRTCLTVLFEIEEVLEFPNDMNNSLSPMNQLLTTSRFYASASHLTAVADFSGIHTSTASRDVAKVSRALAMLRPRYIKMPQSPAQIQQTQNAFFEIAAFPRVLGTVDGTHVKIQSHGGDDGEIYRNRKSYSSINVQVVGNANLDILDLVARWPGSAHDSTIFNNSRVRAQMENGDFPNCLLLGDSGYPQWEYFLTPLGNPQARAEQLYNEAHIRTRNTIERLFGNWKRRFPVLAYGIRFKIETVFTIIVATGVLHNISRTMHEEDIPVLPGAIDGNELDLLIEASNVPNDLVAPQNGNINQVRNTLTNNYFHNL